MSHSNFIFRGHLLENSFHYPQAGAAGIGLLSKGIIYLDTEEYAEYFLHFNYVLDSLAEIA